MSLWETEQRDDGVVIAAYRNDPMNYLVVEGAQEIGGLIAGWQDPAVRAVVLCGGLPGRFITHYSVEELLTLTEDRDALPEACAKMSAGGHALFEGLRALPKPVIVAMTGDTMGGGLELSLACDIRVAEDGPYRIGLPEATVGIMPGGGGTQRLARMLGPGAAVEIILRGRVFTPEQARARGIVHEVAADARARAVEIASELAALSPVALAQIKRALYDGAELPLTEGLTVEGEAFLATMLSDEAAAGMRSYVETPVEHRHTLFQPDARAE